MKLPLLGIVVILCLQLGFTAFNAIDRSMESLAVVNAIKLGSNPVADVFSDATGTALSVRLPDRDTISARSWRRSPRNVEIAYAPAKKVFISLNANGSRRMSQYVAMQRPFESTVITYPRVIMATSETENAPTQIPALAVATEKRSFVTKTASVLKKSFTWIKALGTKFN